MQVSSLISAMGSELENICQSFVFAEDGQRNDFRGVPEKFEEYFIPRRNITHERACFHQRVQRPREKAETFISDLECYEFGTGRSENIRDQIVVGILDKDLS